MFAYKNHHNFKIFEVEHIPFPMPVTTVASYFKLAMSFLSKEKILSRSTVILLKFICACYFINLWNNTVYF